MCDVFAGLTFGESLGINAAGTLVSEIWMKKETVELVLDGRTFLSF